MRTCAVEGCAKPVKARGWCAMHDWRLRTRAFLDESPQRPGVLGMDCGYQRGRIRGVLGAYRGGKQHRAHRYAYEQLVGPIPDGKVLDHICHQRACVNPEHLRPVTPKQNSENRIGASRNSKTGVRGVSYNTKNKRYVAFSKHHGKPNYGGSFATLEEAAEAVKALRLSLHTHNDADRKAP